MSKKRNKENEHIRLLPKSLPYEVGKEDIQLNYIVKNYIPNDKKINICDYGCGNGLLLATLSNYPEKTLGLYLPVDEDEDVLRETGSYILNNPQIAPPYDACKPDKLDMEKYGGKFDLVILHHVLHEVVHPQEIFEQIFKLLKPEAKILIGDFTHFWWYEPDHVFWDCNTVKEFFDSKKFNVNCISHRYRDKYGHFFAEVSLKKGAAFPEKNELLWRIKNIYEKMFKFYQDRINTITKKHPFKEKPQDVQVYETLSLHALLRLKDVEDEIEIKVSRPPYLFNIASPEPNFVGRVEMLEAITRLYKSPDVPVGVLIGWGGVGKSALVRKWYDSLKDNDIFPDGIFWWGFYHHAEFERFLNALLEYLDQSSVDLSEIKTTWAKVDKIKELIQKREYLVVLDGLEEMQEGKSGDTFGFMTHPEFKELLTYIADAMERGLCLITSRYPIKDLENWKGNSYYRELPIVDLDLEDAKALLKKRNIKGEESDFEEIIKRFKGHALALTSLAGYLNKYCKGDIHEAPDVPFVFEEKERWKDVNKLFRRYAEKMSDAELSFLKIFSLFRTEITERDFLSLFRKPIEGTKVNSSLIGMNGRDFIDLVHGLVEWRLISYDEEKKTYTIHPLTKGYFESIFEEEDKRSCHKRIYQYIGFYAPEKPETLEKMQPLFEQIYHGCKAGLYDEVLYDIHWRKIYRGKEYFIMHKLGAWETTLSLIKNFFPKGKFSNLPLISKKSAQSELLNEAGLALLSIGRSKEAEVPLLTGVKMYIDAKDWESASVGYQNLADLQFRTGELELAFSSTKKALNVAKKSEAYGEICLSKAYLARMLHLLGRNKKAGKEFKQADELQMKIKDVRLYSLAGIWYAEFLLSNKRIDKASELTWINLEVCKSNNWLNDISRCHRCLGAIERIKGNYDEAMVHIREALKLANKVGMPSLEIEALLESGRLHLDMGRNEDAIRAGNKVLTLCSRTGFKLYEPDAEVVLAKVYLALGDIDKAKDFANSAYEKATQMNYHWPKVDATNLLEEISRTWKDSIL